HQAELSSEEIARRQETDDDVLAVRGRAGDLGAPSCHDIEMFGHVAGCVERVVLSPGQRDHAVVDTDKILVGQTGEERHLAENLHAYRQWTVMGLGAGSPQRDSPSASRAGNEIDRRGCSLRYRGAGFAAHDCLLKVMLDAPRRISTCFVSLLVAVMVRRACIRPPPARLPRWPSGPARRRPCA